jgi:hypothetical protein
MAYARPCMDAMFCLIASEVSPALWAHAFARRALTHSRPAATSTALGYLVPCCAVLSMAFPQGSSASEATLATMLPAAPLAPLPPLPPCLVSQQSVSVGAASMVALPFAHLQQEVGSLGGGPSYCSFSLAGPLTSRQGSPESEDDAPGAAAGVQLLAAAEEHGGSEPVPSWRCLPGYLPGSAGGSAGQC